MTDRPSSSRAFQGDRSSNRLRQDSHGPRTRDRNVIEWILGRHNRPTDQQASTSRGLDNDTSDKWQKRFQVLLDDYRMCLNDIAKYDKETQDKTIEKWRQEFQQANESKQEEQVKELRDLVRNIQPDKFQDDEQIAIDEELGYFLKSPFEELRDVREAALKFLAERIEKKIENGIEVKIEKESDKLEEIRKWTQAIDDYCTNHKQRVIDSAYCSVVDDIALLYKHDLDKIENAKREDIYKNDNEGVYFIIKEINLSLYSTQDRETLNWNERREAEREWQNLANWGQDLDDERSYPSSDSNHEGRRNTIIRSDDEEIRNVSLEQSQLDQATQQSLELSQLEQAIQQALELSQTEHATQQALELSQLDQATQQALELSQLEQATQQALELSQLEQATQQALELSQLEHAIQQALEQSQLDQATQQAPEQFNPRVNPHRDLEGPAPVSGGGSLIRTQLWQIFERIHRIVQPYHLEHDHRPQSQALQGLEQRYEVIDVSHMASPQILNLDEVLRQQLQSTRQQLQSMRQQLQSMWRRMLRSDA